jgi:cytochrome c oxidase subunit IV
MERTEARAHEPEKVEREGLPAEDAAHPGPRQYIQIAVVLAGVTLLEVLAYYVERGTFEFVSIPRGALVFLLIVMMVLKFVLVVLWYMHLRFDSPIYQRLFLTGLLLVLSVFLVVLLTFGAGFWVAVGAVALSMGLTLGLMWFLARRRPRA